MIRAASKSCVALLVGLSSFYPTVATYAADAHAMPAMAGMDDMGDMQGMDMGDEKSTMPSPPPQQPRAQAPHGSKNNLPSTPQRTSASMAAGGQTHAQGQNTHHMPMHVTLPALAPSEQWPATPPITPAVHYIHNMPPVMDHNTYFHVLMEQFEGRYTAGNSLLRYSGQSWFGTDYNKLWIKSEGTVDGHGHMSDGDHEFLYDHVISTYFDVQTGVRLDLDSGPTRAWGAVGVQGLALYFFDVSATAYFNAQGVAGKLEGSYDLLITNRLILQPQAELNFYSHTDAQRNVSRGFSDIDAGLRLRYEFKRKIAPYIAVTYAGHYGNTANRAANGHGAADNGVEDIRFTFGVRTWF